MTPIEKRWAPFAPKIKQLALHLLPPTAHANDQGYQVLADALRIHRNTVSAWVNGNSAPAAAMFERIDTVAKSNGFVPEKVKVK